MREAETEVARRAFLHEIPPAFIQQIARDLGSKLSKKQDSADEEADDNDASIEGAANAAGATDAANAQIVPALTDPYFGIWRGTGCQLLTPASDTVQKDCGLKAQLNELFHAIWPRGCVDTIRDANSYWQESAWPSA